MQRATHRELSAKRVRINPVQLERLPELAAPKTNRGSESRGRPNVEIVSPRRAGVQDIVASARREALESLQHPSGAMTERCSRRYHFRQQEQVSARRPNDYFRAPLRYTQRHPETSVFANARKAYEVEKRTKANERRQQKLAKKAKAKQLREMSRKAEEERRARTAANGPSTYTLLADLAQQVYTQIRERAQAEFDTVPHRRTRPWHVPGAPKTITHNVIRKKPTKKPTGLTETDAHIKKSN